MTNGFSEELFLKNETAKRLYHSYAENLPIIDYHCHLQPREIFEDKEFEDLGEMWLSGDHYKWRVMRTFGIDEELITGRSDYREKFMAFAGILPKLIGNPIYIWCALELKRYFGIDEPLGPDNAEEIYERTCELIHQHHMTPSWCIEHSKVHLVSTTEDPIDDLKYHQEIKKQNKYTKVISAFRPDNAMFIERESFPGYLSELEHVSNVQISSFKDVINALENRLCYFKEITGTPVSDNGIPQFRWVDYTESDAEKIFKKGMNGEQLSEDEEFAYKSAFLYEMACLYKRHGYVMQLHIGSYLDANTKGVVNVGKSTGFDCIDDRCHADSVGSLLNKLTLSDNLPKTILYPLDGTKIEAWAVLAAGFCDNGTKAKVQLGAPWWFNDQVYGIQRQFESCANLYPVSLSVGMLTDSRSFISYPRHELYRRVLCNYLGELVERGEYFSGDEALKQIIYDVCYNNVNEFFGFNLNAI